MKRIWNKIEPLGMTWADFARAMGTDNQNVNNWKKRGISKSRIAEAARVAGTSTDYIMTGEGSIGLTASPKATVSPKVSDAADRELPGTINLQGTSRETQKIINDILNLEAEGSFQGVAREMIQNAVDAIGKKPNRSAASFRAEYENNESSTIVEDEVHISKKPK